MDIFEQMDLALAESYGNGFEAGVKLTCEELVKIFEGIPMWGTVAVSKVKTFLDTYSKIVNTREGETSCENQK
jgi:hypothetical protein